jgi:hypothetical protein
MSDNNQFKQQNQQQNQLKQNQQQNQQQQLKQNQKQNDHDEKLDVNSAQTTVMDLEKLKTDYSLQLNAYKQAVADYDNYLKQNPENADNTSTNYAVIPGKQFWGTGQADAKGGYSGVNIEKCKALCASNSKCSGATFSPDTNGQTMCWLRTGEGDLSPALDTDNALIPESQKYLLTIESINKQLIQTNEQIQKIVQQSESVYDSIKTDGQAQSTELIQSYTQLTNERDKITEKLKAYKVLDESEEKGKISITQNYYSYILLVIIAIGAIIILYNFSGIFSSESSGTETSGTELTSSDDGASSSNKYYIILIIIIVIIIVASYGNIKTTASNVSVGAYDSVSSLFSGIGSIFSSNSINY